MKHLKNILVILIISIIITFTFDFFFGGVSANYKGLLLNILYGFIIGGSLSLTGFITRIIIKNLDINKSPVKTYVILLIAIFLFIIIDVFAINTAWYSVTQGFTLAQLFNNTSFIISNFITILIGLIIFLIILSKTYIVRLISNEKKVQEAKNELIKFQYKTLQNQVNPHFLFNSLNNLSSMISIEPEKAEDFTNHLSKLYRYILEKKDVDLVQISEEISFIENYIILQKYRFGNNIIFEIEEQIRKIDGQIIPMSLQLLVENAIKHNIVSEEKKLNIKITIEEDNYLCVINNVQIKESGKDSLNIGLKNIEKRYSFITDKTCVFENTETLFKVKIPIV